MKAKLVSESIEELNEGKFGRALATAGLAGALTFGAHGQMKDIPSQSDLRHVNPEMYIKWIGAQGQDENLKYEDWVKEYSILLKIAENEKAIKSIVDYQKGDIRVHSGTYKDKKLEEQVMLLTKNQINAGNYQVRGVNKMLGGGALMIAGAGVSIWSASSMAKLDPTNPKWTEGGKITTQTTPNQNPYSPEEEADARAAGIRLQTSHTTTTHEDPAWGYDQAVKLRKAGQYTGLLMGIVGAGLEISGILDLKKAGIALNPNGLTLTLDF